MRIGILSRDLLPFGSLRWAEGWGSGLAELGHEVTLIFVRGGRGRIGSSSSSPPMHVEIELRGGLAAISRAVGAPILRLKDLANAFPDDVAPEPLSWVLAPFVGRWRQKFDLVICHDPLVGIAGLMGKHQAGVPYVVFVHEVPFVWDPFPFRRVLKFWQTSVFKSAVLRCGVSERVAQRAAKVLGIPFAVMEHGCHPSASIQQVKQDFVLLDTRWSESRRPEFVLDIAERVPQVNFIVAGSFASGELYERFKFHLHEKKLTDRVETRLDLDEGQLRGLYRNAACYVRWPARGRHGLLEVGPSFGVFQALEEGCPIVVTDDLAPAPILQRAGAAEVAANTAESLASAVSRVVEDRQHSRELSSNAWSLAHAWAWSVRASQMLRALEAATGG